MIEEILHEVQVRGITRLCHFTPSRNLPHIVTNQTGILSTWKLRADEQAVFTTTDDQRLDGYGTYVCCSIEYPNAWYLSRARENEKLFRDWVIVFIRPIYLWAKGTGFCPRNAASGRGQYVGFGPNAFRALYAECVPGAGGRLRPRIATLLPCCPTDQQAEVLVPEQIKFTDILGVAVRDCDQARNEIARLELSALSTYVLKFVVAPELFDARSLSRAIQQGRRPAENVWTPT
jgi:hypothetical protein